jgi:hypothetical protein
LILIKLLGRCDDGKRNSLFLFTGSRSYRSDVRGPCLKDTLLPRPPVLLQSKNVYLTWVMRFPHHLATLDLMRGLSRFSSHLKAEASRTSRKVFSNGEFTTGYLYPLLHKCLNLTRHNPDVDEYDGAILQACRLAYTLFQAEIRCLFGINGVISEVQLRGRSTKILPCEYCRTFGLT